MDAAPNHPATGGASLLGKLVREPLLHFALAGVVLMWLAGRDGAPERDGGAAPRLSTEIRLEAGQLELLRSQWAKSRQRPPTTAEMQGLIDDYVRDEVYYREALAMGLADGDVIVRRRMRQKLEFVSEDVASFAEPSDAELASYLAQHPAAYRIGDRYSFSQVLVKLGPDADTTRARARDLVRTLRDLPAGADPLALGDATMMPKVLEGAAAREIEAQFGPDFAAGLAPLTDGVWGGPIESPYGLHVVRIQSRVPGQMPPLAQVRAAVERDWRVQRRLAAAEAFYAELRGRYTVVVDGVPQPAPGAGDGDGDQPK